jgi:hypothetical protein
MNSLVIEYVEDILLDTRNELEETFMSEFTWNDHRDEDIMTESHQLFEDVDIGVDDDAAEEDDVEVKVFDHVLPKFGYLYNRVFAVLPSPFGNCMIFANEALCIETVFNDLFFDK